MDRDGSRAATGEAPPAAAAGPTPSRPPPSPGIEALAAEALAFDGESNEESIDVRVEKALECPCLDDFKRGPCGSQFIDAFSCYLKSTKEEKLFISGRFLLNRNNLLVPALQGSDCVNPFIALQNCIGENKEAFIKEILEEEENDEEDEKSNLKVLPPAWSREPKSKTRGHSK
ncbi:mitochondrial intermembrane space import and assembly protein 40-like [Panicum miliaceum]|uniref:Mitochondrial intermembrane space import and assembly protein 40-like n=1 Tax=Panicum miliaceum TaxID=4540 RepID=A0A3L6QIS8_PANMI|nr:mitochondrial intermembrane space import and assembly protein 40-like [Panicum miliaceum]